MGGCRCTYKNCTVRSDGKTHLFHYPVFDKVRCHEWLSNAGRYDFLNLKVSQLKNRCICQHHFSDEWFMNDKTGDSAYKSVIEEIFGRWTFCEPIWTRSRHIITSSPSNVSFKEKLKSQAVPTLDGPFCDSSKFKDPGMSQNMLGVYPLACEVIDNDDFLDRKSNYNVVYADFLTNSEGIDTCVNSIEHSKNVTNRENVTPVTNNNLTKLGYTLRSANTDDNISRKDNMYVAQRPHPLAPSLFVEIPPFSAEQINANGAQKVKTEETPLPVKQNNADIIKTQNLPLQKQRGKVQIISEKKIIDPEKKISVPVFDESFKTVKPSMILNINKNMVKSNFNNEKQQQEPFSENVCKSMVKEVMVEPKTDKLDSILLNNVSNTCKNEGSGITEILNTSDPSQFEIKMDIIETTSSSKLTSNQKNITKNKLSPERVAAIREKRMFNMKLKDIIAQELSRLDEQNSPDINTLIPKKRSKNLRTEPVMASLSNDPDLPNEHAYIVHYLEARMEKMENLLLQKIDQNTQKIMDLKRIFDTQRQDLPDSRISSEKPNMSHEAHKKYLFNEISKYLMPTSNNLIYEELFINKYDPNEHKAGISQRTSKRKRNRRC